MRTRATGRIDAPTLVARFDDVRVLDVRTAAEFEAAHIPGALHIPLDALAARGADICGVEEDVVIVCRSGTRADQASARLAAAGATDLAVLEGGMNAWVSAGGAVVRGEERWSLERQVRLVAGGLVLTGILASIRFPAAKWVSGFVGAGLTFAALSNTCAMANLLSRLPYNRAGNQASGTDADEAVRSGD